MYVYTYVYISSSTIACIYTYICAYVSERFALGDKTYELSIRVLSILIKQTAKDESE